MVYERVDRTPTLPGNFRGPPETREEGAEQPLRESGAAVGLHCHVSLRSRWSSLSLDCHASASEPVALACSRQDHFFPSAVLATEKGARV